MAKKSTKKVTAESTPVAPQFKISVDFGGHVYEGVGVDAKEALLNLTAPTKITTKAVVHVSHGDKSKTLLMVPQKAKRLYWKVARDVNAKMLSALLK